MFDLFTTIKGICPEAECYDDQGNFRVHVSEENFWRINQLLENNMPVVLVAQQDGTVGPGGIFPKAFWAPEQVQQPQEEPKKSWIMVVWNFLKRPVL